MEALSSATKQAFTIFLFNPEGIQVAMDFIKGHYEVTWIIVMMAAVVMLNVRFWNFTREQSKNPIPFVQAVGEAFVHWTLSNLALFLSLEAHKLVYGWFTEFVPAKSYPPTHGRLKNVMINALSKLRLTDGGSSVMIPRVRSPYLPFAILFTTSLLALFLSMVIKNRRLATLSS